MPKEVNAQACADELRRMGAACCSDGLVPARQDPFGANSPPPPELPQNSVLAEVPAQKGGTAPTLDLGEGVKVFADGSRYEGQWKDGKKSGKGRYIYPDGDVYEGQWLDDKAHGEGFHQSKQSRYNGQWAMDLKHGYATEDWDDGSKYTGQYHNGQKHGKGMFVWPEGSTFEG